MLWQCVRCDQLHDCNPPTCANCGYTIFELNRTEDVSEISPPSSVGDTITASVAQARNVDTDELPPLTDVVDTDALERLLQDTDTRTGGQIQFQYDGFDVTVYPSGTVEIGSRDGD